MLTTGCRRHCRSLLHYSTAAERLASYKNEDMASVDHLVIGAGVVGLAVGRALSSGSGIRKGASARSTLVIDKNKQFGMETSSRNSEVIHGGIYYPKDSLRTRLCIEGKHLMYEYCKQNDVPHRRIGKWVVAQDDKQAEYLSRLAQHCTDLGISTEMIGESQAQQIEPNVRAHMALVSPTTGIVDTHAFMAALHRDLLDNGADFAANTEVVAIEHIDNEYRVLVSTSDPDTPYMGIRAATVVNAAGLWADRITDMLAPQSKHDWHTQYRLHFAKGRYYMYTGDARIRVQRLIYPVPDKHITSLGTHLIIDMGGAIRFGPDIEWIKSNDDYSIDSGDQNQPFMNDVAAEIAKYLPSIRTEDLSPGYTGIRPKLQPPGGAFRDFVVREESDAGFPGFVNLVGIESPGLTSSLAIARLVDQLLN
ncbi:hypothetical protein LPJ66_004692 [Kickxella alabastrina]|uniref:Uncharacterized protein n=1 Tax=Kickxella alabastrina TaxID=61397 RepID=A0ACC1IIZ2_9FUNG|nr:hypothetical protein LPJ66_004692 [Kickxella alabastrina]